jgi:SNF2 family DNA or RNA helicase
VEKLNESLEGSVKIYGGMTAAAKQRATDAFNAEGGPPALVGQIESAGQGWSCTSADACAFAELDWRPAMHAQAEDRTHGLYRGSGGGSTSYYLIAEGTIEEALAQAIERKQNVARAAVDGGGGDDMNVFTEFMRVLKRGA